MSAERLVVLLICGLCLATGVAAEEAPAPEAEAEAEFIEYLGMWDLTDEDWQLLEEEMAAAEERSEPAPEGEASTETEDEG